MVIQTKMTPWMRLPRILTQSLKPRGERRWQVGGAIYRAALGMLACTIVACGIADDGKLPTSVEDPSAQQTPRGAMSRYRAVLALLPEAFDWYLTETGVLTDEMAALPAPMGTVNDYTGIDSRQDLSGFEENYNRLQTLRVHAREARGFVEAFAPDSSPALAGHLYALEGYAELFLSDLFCSGVPLSSVDFGGDYTLAQGSTTAEVYQHAAALFDSAVARTNDSMRVQHFAAIGRGRALLALGEYAAAAAAVTAVPDAYIYQVVYTAASAAPSNPGSRLLVRFADSRTATQNPAGVGYRAVPATPGVGDSEGLNGLDYRSSSDPRTGVVTRPNTDPFGNTMYFPAKYPPTGATATLTVADWIEARLIAAEAALQANPADGQWLALLNQLRQTAISPALSDTTDPGTEAARVDLLFRERAFWLYLTGHRQGDLRRLIRKYGRAPTAVYPTGSYAGGGSGTYGAEVVAPVPPAERELNPNYAGCFNHDA